MIEMGAGVSLLAVRPVDSPASVPLKDLVNGLAVYAIVVALAAVLIGGIGWALGERMGFGSASVTGRRGVIAGLMLAFLVGFIATPINFLIREGDGINSRPVSPPVQEPEAKPGDSESLPALPAPPPQPVQVVGMGLEAKDPEKSGKIIRQPCRLIVNDGEDEWKLTGSVIGELPTDHRLFVLNRNLDPSQKGWIDGKANQEYKAGSSKEWYVQGEIESIEGGVFGLDVRIGGQGDYFNGDRILTVILVYGEILDYLRSQVENHPRNEMIPTKGWLEVGSIHVAKSKNDIPGCPN